MFGIGTQEIFFILAIALIVMGPKKLPEIAKAIGKGLREFQKAMNTDDDLEGPRSEEDPFFPSAPENDDVQEEHTDAPFDTSLPTEETMEPH